MSVLELEHEELAEEGWNRIGHLSYHPLRKVALCGKRIRGIPVTPPWELCVVCADLHEQERQYEQECVDARRRLEEIDDLPWQTLAERITP